MVQIDVPLTFGVGSVFAAAVERGLRSSQAPYFYWRALGTNLLVQIFLFIWFSLYFLVAEFGLQTSHMWFKADTILPTAWLMPVFFLVYFAANLSGFHLGVWLVLHGRARLVWLVLAVCVLFATGWVALQPYRTLGMGTYGQWQAGELRWAWTDGMLFTAAVADFAVLIVAVVWLYRRLARDAAKAATP
jgi:hypothetical protein